MNPQMGSWYSGTCNLEMEADSVYKHAHKLITHWISAVNERSWVMCWRVPGQESWLGWDGIQEGLPEDVTLELRPAGQERTHHEKIFRRKGLPGGGGPAL